MYKGQKEFFDQIKELCNCNAIAIDLISKDYNINPNLVAKLFITTMSMILEIVQEDE